MKQRRKSTPELTEKRKAVARRVFPPGPDHPAARYDADKRELIVAMFRDFVPVKKIQAMTGASRDTITRYCRMAGLPKRRKPARYDPARFKEGWQMVDGKPKFVG